MSISKLTIRKLRAEMGYQLVSNLMGPIPEADLPQYQLLLDSLIDEYRPTNEGELALVRTMADTHWRLRRVPALEAACYTQGRELFAHLYPEHAPGVRADLIDLETLGTFERELTKLHTAESRLIRLLCKTEKDLRTLRSHRAALEYLSHYRPVPTAPPAPAPVMPPPVAPAPSAECKVLATFLPNDFAYTDR